MFVFPLKNLARKELMQMQRGWGLSWDINKASFVKLACFSQEFPGLHNMKGSHWTDKLLSWKSERKLYETSPNNLTWHDPAQSPQPRCCFLHPTHGRRCPDWSTLHPHRCHVPGHQQPTSQTRHAAVTRGSVMWLWWWFGGKVPSQTPNVPWNPSILQ